MRRQGGRLVVGSRPWPPGSDLRYLKVQPRPPRDPGQENRPLEQSGGPWAEAEAAHRAWHAYLDDQDDVDDVFLARARAARRVARREAKQADVADDAADAEAAAAAAAPDAADAAADATAAAASDATAADNASDDAAADDAARRPRSSRTSGRQRTRAAAFLAAADAAADAAPDAWQASGSGWLPAALAADPILDASRRWSPGADAAALQRWRESMAASRGLEPWWPG